MATKIDQATQIYNDNPGAARQDVMQLFMSTLDMTKPNAASYYQMVKKKAQVSSTSHKVSPLDKETVDNINRDIISAMEGVALKHGLTVEVGDREVANLDVSARAVFSVGTKDDVAKRRWIRYNSTFGLSDDLFGQEFDHSTETFVVRGINPKNEKFPVIASRIRDGKKFIFPTEMFKG